MTDRFQSIRDALAMGPTPGPWAWGHNIAASSDVIHCIEVTAKDRTGSVAYMLSYTADDYDNRAETIANAHLIAACDPDTIRELLRQRDELLSLARRDAEAGDRPHSGPSAIDAPAPTEATP